MAIINMISNWEFRDGVRHERMVFPDGAYCPLEYNQERTARNAVILYHTHEGFCLYEREMNGRDDSDFYMAVWNPEKGCIEEVLFASTRGWTYPCYGSTPDATPEVLAAVQAYKDATLRRSRIIARWAARRNLRKCASQCNLSTEAYKRLVNAYGQGETLQRVQKLLSTNLRSTFRIKLAAQARAWANDPTPKFRTPFSAKQLPYV